jgi:predicted ester cyclase
MTSPAESKTIVQAMEDEIFNRRNLAAIDRFIGPDYTLRTAAPGTKVGRDEIRAAIGAYLDGFSDLHAEVEEIVASGDRVAAVIRFTGTHDGVMFGLAPTGKSIDVRQIAMYRVVEGQVVDEWEVSDQLGLLQQLGAIPAAQ